MKPRPRYIAPTKVDFQGQLFSRPGWEGPCCQDRELELSSDRAGGAGATQRSPTACSQRKPLLRNGLEILGSSSILAPKRACSTVCSTERSTAGKGLI